MCERYLQEVEVEDGALRALASNRSGVHSIAWVVVGPVKGKLQCRAAWIFTNQRQPEIIPLSYVDTTTMLDQNSDTRAM